MPSQGHLEQMALRTLRELAEHDLFVLCEEPPDDLLRDNGWTFEKYRDAIRTALRDLNREKKGKRHVHR